MRYFIILFFLGLVSNAISQTEINSAIKKDTVVQKESLKSDSDNYRQLEEVEIESKERSKKVTSSNRVQTSSINQSPGIQEQTIQLESANFSSYKAQSQTQTQQRSPTEFKQQQMNGAVSYFETNAPESFEYHYYKYISGNYNTVLFPHLQKAEQLKPNNSDVHVQMTSYYMVMNADNEALKYLDKLVTSKRLAPSVVLYAEDVLRSVPENGVLITHGFDDTYGVWYAQIKKGIRKDVTIISLDLMQSSKYLDLLKSKGFVIPNSSVIDVAFLNQFCHANASENLSISLTTPKDYFKSMLSQVYLSGLVFEYRTSTFDNFWRNEILWDKELKKELVENTVDEKGRSLSSNYLPMLFQMRKVYNQTGKDQKVKEMDAAIDKIGAQTNKYQQVQKMKDAY